MTEKLYYLDPYQKECKARIIETIQKKEQVHLVLDRTIFYPEGGGQPADKGWINDMEVVDVYEKEDIVYHVVDTVPQTTEVQCNIDWERRFDHMQQHTGEHLVASTFYQILNVNSEGFHMGAEYVTLDFPIDHIDQEQLVEIEEEINKRIYQNLEIKHYFVDKPQADQLPLRKTPTVEENIRVVEIHQYDYSPCCGTHLARTGELGIIKLLKSEKYKGMTRVYFLSGKRALKDFQIKNTLCTQLFQHFSANAETIMERVERSSEEAKNGSYKIKQLQEEISAMEADILMDTTKGNVFKKDYKTKSFEEIQMIAKHLLENESHVIILSTLSEKRVFFAHGSNSSIHCGKIFKEHIKTYHGKGGGSQSQAQGKFEEEGELLEFTGFLSEYISGDLL